MHKRQIMLSLILVVILSVVVSGIALGKAHVPARTAQFCDGVTTKEVGPSQLKAEVDAGNFRVPACDFDNVFPTGGVSCSGDVDADGDGFMDGAHKVPVVIGTDGSACGGITPACRGPVNTANPANLGGCF